MERRRTRDELLAATAAALTRIRQDVQRRTKTPLSAAEIGQKVGKVIARNKMGKHFELTIAVGEFHFAQRSEAIAREAELDGLDVIRTSESQARLSPRRSCAATRVSPKWSGPSAPSRAWSCASARSTPAPRRGCAPTSSCVCSLTTSNGTYAAPGRACCSTTKPYRWTATSATPWRRHPLRGGQAQNHRASQRRGSPHPQLPHPDGRACHPLPPTVPPDGRSRQPLHQPRDRANTDSVARPATAAASPSTGMLIVRVSQYSS